MRKIGKKGQAHIEMILAFTLFISFVVTMLFLFKPNVRSRDISLAVVEKGVLTNISVDVNVFTVKTSILPCFCFTNGVQQEILGNAVVKNITKGNINSWKDSAGHICINSGSSTFFYVYSSPEFSASPAGSCSNVITDAEFGSTRRFTAISNNSLMSLKTRFETDYEGLRQELQLNYDFRLALFNGRNEIVFELERPAPFGRPVYSRDIDGEIIYKDGSTENVILRIYAW